MGYYVEDFRRKKRRKARLRQASLPSKGEGQPRDATVRPVLSPGRLSGVALMLIASTCFVLMNVLVKVVSPTIPTIEIVMWRCLVPLPVLVWLVRRAGLPMWPRKQRLLWLRSGMGLLAMSLSFYAVARLSLADVAVLGRLQPILVALLAAVFLHERVRRLTLMCVAVSFSGVALLLKPSLDVGNLAGIAALLAAGASATAHVSVRRLSADEHPIVIVLAFTTLVAFFTLPLSLAYMVWPQAQDALALLGVGVFSTAGQLLMTKAYALQEASAVAAASYSSVVVAALCDYLFFGATPGGMLWFGGTLVVGAGLVLLWANRVRRQQRFDHCDGKA